MMNKIETMLLELKDTSEFMVDLAYSSLLYNNSEIAEEVIFLEGRMDELGAAIQEQLLNVAKDNPDVVAKFSVILRLQMAAEEIANAAASIADVVLRGLGEHPVIQMSIQESEVTIERATVSDDSILVGKKFGDIRLGSISGMYVIAIKRGNQFIYGPDKFTTINAGDVLIARGPEESADYFMDLATGEAREF
ncbi:MAG: TrkA C-terminal domain-containing protein [Methanomassiliicoccales archaeon]|uniref:potassium channel family protein n=1 Tax=Candidatus Methanarcanum hacksteinii TaxID=2911857 RepID=UPI0015AB670C|nr:potassium channel protein [Candidatus Methanomethylophilaceae archaeon]MCI6024566.1 potassium channel protein [Methanomassiliicoccales archaeon]MDY4580206.1 TrkA C-terminal domain-containing protein [Candidatus Methanarcanum hacksteinii]MDD7478925.1 TrkA C-terminal domain-containing protein [Methanomassiliicoccales archaeon]MDO5837913.1 TrkA C-terminal domain-containing protein [Methanomassiliicoccales archaeon]